jgi:hypothetical protein
VTWDAVEGLAGVNPEGAEAIQVMFSKRSGGGGDFGGVDPKALTRNPIEAMVMLADLPEKTLAWWMNPQRTMDNPQFIQAMANLRDEFRGTMRTWVGVGPDVSLPPEVQYDVIVLDEELPDMARLGVIATELYQAAQVKPQKGEIDRCAQSVRGVSAFMAENLLALSMTPGGVDFQALARKRKAAVEQVPGLTLEDAPVTLDEIGGNAQAKALAVRISRMGVGMVVVIDEIEKLLGAAGTDLSGVTGDQLAVILRTMDGISSRLPWTGVVCVGHPGCGKTLFAKALGTAARCPTITWDLGAAKGSLVGQSEARMRAGSRAINALAGEARVVVVATCNRMESLPPELIRRFSLSAPMFFDLPEKTERESIQTISAKKHGLDKKAGAWPDTDGWTGAEIRNAAQFAALCNVSLKDAAETVVPYAVSGKQKVEMLRRAAAGNWLSASYVGPYRYPDDVRATSPKARAFARKEG